MPHRIYLDNVEHVRVINDRPIRCLLLIEASVNVIFVGCVVVYPSAFLNILLTSDRQITSLAMDLFYWWISCLVVFTGVMLAMARSSCRTSTFTAGLVHGRRTLYWCLLASELLLAYLLVVTSHRTSVSNGAVVGLVFLVIGRLFVLLVKNDWFGTVCIDSMTIKSIKHET
jgi:hypothetical protein